MHTVPTIVSEIKQTKPYEGPGASSQGGAPLGKCAVIVAGGTGSRVGSALPKQFCDLGGRPMLWWTLEAFRREDPAVGIVVAMHPDYIGMWSEMVASWGADGCARHVVVPGGATRRESVARALEAVPEDCGLIAVHDAARPLVSEGVIARGWEAAAAAGAAVPVVAVSDSLRHMESDGASRAVARSEYVAVQTPQVFDAGILRRAYAGEDSPAYTDDASVVEAAGYPVALFAGEAENFKVTQPHDLILAELLLSKRCR